MRWHELVAVGCALGLAMQGCAAWIPIQNASEASPGHAVKIELPRGTMVVSGLLRCDGAGVIVSTPTRGCDCAGCTFDMHRTRVFVHESVIDVGVPISIIALAFAGILVALLADWATRQLLRVFLSSRDRRFRPITAQPRACRRLGGMPSRRTARPRGRGGPRLRAPRGRSLGPCRQGSRVLSSSMARGPQSPCAPRRCPWA